MKILLAVVVVAMLGAAVLFSVENASPVTVCFYNLQFTASLAVVVFLSALAGAAIATFVLLSLRFTRSIRRRGRVKKAKQEQNLTAAQDMERDGPRPTSDNPQ